MPSSSLAEEEFAPPIKVGLGFHSDAEEVLDVGFVCQPHSSGYALVLMRTIILPHASDSLIWSLEVQRRLIRITARSLPITFDAFVIGSPAGEPHSA